MKCEHCGKNDVTFVYRSSVNGHTEEAHLCADCAEKLGFTQRLANQSRSLFQNFLGGGAAGGLFADPFGQDPFASDPFFSSFPSVFSRSARSLMGRMMDNPFDDFFADMPALGAAADQAEAGKAPEAEPPAQADQGEDHTSRFSRLRERNALKMEMKRAIHEENFERAAELRDQLRQMEQADQ